MLIDARERGPLGYMPFYNRVYKGSTTPYKPEAICAAVCATAGTNLGNLRDPRLPVRLLRIKSALWEFGVLGPMTGRLTFGISVSRTV
jgi:hypothetical protein